MFNCRGIGLQFLLFAFPVLCWKSSLMCHVFDLHFLSFAFSQSQLMNPCCAGLLLNLDFSLLFVSTTRLFFCFCILIIFANENSS